MADKLEAKWQIDSAIDTLLRAEEIKKDKNLLNKPLKQWKKNKRTYQIYYEKRLLRQLQKNKNI